MAKIMDPILPILSALGYWAIILGSFGGPGKSLSLENRLAWLAALATLSRLHG